MGYTGRLTTNFQPPICVMYIGPEAPIYYTEPTYFSYSTLQTKCNETHPVLKSDLTCFNLTLLNCLDFKIKTLFVIQKMLGNL